MNYSEICKFNLDLTVLIHNLGYRASDKNIYYKISTSMLGISYYNWEQNQIYAEKQISMHIE